MNIQDFTCSLTNEDIPWRLFIPAAATKEYCVLWLQGWTSAMNFHREGVARMAEKTGITFATMDFAGHGMHKTPLGESTHHQQHNDVVAIFDELQKAGYQKIIVIGGSFGGYMTALLTAKRPVHATILRAPANYDDAEFDTPYKNTLRHANHNAFQRQKEDGNLLTNTMATQAIRNYDGPVYVLLHELDEEVPVHIPRSYFEAAKHGNFIIIPKTKHSPKLMPNPQIHFDYIEHTISSIITAIQLQDKL